MALYRETATGFLCEYASNPGAGYTAISAQPTDTVANRVTWWRGLDTYGQTTAWHPSEYRSPQDPAEAALSIQFTREAAFISADHTGAVTDAYLGANTQVRVYRGTSDVTITEGWSLTKVEDGCTSTLTESGGVYTLAITNIPLLATAQGYVRITATRIGVSVVKDFRFLKVQDGQDGANGSSGIVINLDNEAHVIPTDGYGNNGVFTDAASTATIYLGASNDSANWTWATPSVSSGVTGTASNGNRTYAVNGLSADTGTVTFSASRTGYATQTAVFSLSKSKSGRTLAISTTAQVIKGTTSVTPTQFSLSAVGTVPTANLVWEYSNSQGATPTWSPYASGVSSVGPIGGNYANRDATYGWFDEAQAIFRVRVTDSVTGISDVVTITRVSDGVTGTRGSRQILVTTADGAWSNTTAWNGIVSQTGTNPIPSDLVTIAKSDGSVANSKFYVSGGSPGTWTTPTAYINGNLLVTGTVGANQIAANSITADRIDSRNLTIKDASGNIILGVGTPLNSSYIASGAANLVRSLALWTANSPNYIVSGESAAVDGESVVYPNTSTATAVSPTFPLFGGYAYSVSLKAWAYSGTRNITVRLINSSGGGVLASKVVTLTTDFTRIELNYTPGSNYTAYMQVYCASGSTTVQIADAKTELGATMTPWTPHSYDVVGTANPVTNSNITTYIANAAIDTAQIKDLAITSAKIGNATITDANISSLSASKINAGTLSANYISGGTINGTNVTVTNLSATNITGGTLSVDRISANSISGSKITIGGIETGNLAAGAVTWIDSKGRVRASPLSQTTTSGAEIEIAQSTAPANSNRGSILITCLLDVASPSYGAAPTQACNLFIYRGGTLLDYQGIYVVSQYYHQMALSFVDTSAPTSATTYYFKWKWTTGASGCLVAGSITLMELKR